MNYPKQLNTAMNSALSDLTAPLLQQVIDAWTELKIQQHMLSYPQDRFGGLFFLP